MNIADSEFTKSVHLTNVHLHVFQAKFKRTKTEFKKTH